MRRQLDRYRRVLEHLLPQAVVWIGSLLASFFIIHERHYLGVGLALITLMLILWARAVRFDAARQPVARTLLLVCVGWGATTPAINPLAAISLGLMISTLMVETSLSHAIRPALLARDLPGLIRTPLDRIPDPMLWANSIAIGVLSLGLLGPGNLALVLALLVAMAGLIVAILQLRGVRRHRSERAISQAIQSYQPRWALYYAGTSHGAYQIRMWLPYLQQTGERGILIVRDPRFLESAAQEFDLPVLLSRSVESLEYVVPKLAAVFYVNNHAKNTDGVRFSQVKHVHLGHGDSDKPASYSATFGMFNQIFVAGQAAVERFPQHGVLIPSEKFVLVGRPQVAELEVRESDSPLPTQPVVLYAPTWRGGLQDSKFGSLDSGEQIVAALLAAGSVVWFRPHPYSARDAESRVHISRIDALLAAAGTDHASSTATAQHSIHDCFNASDALLTDVSSLASDYLYTNKPLAMTDTGVVADLHTSYPVTKAAAVLRLDEDLADAVRRWLEQDTLQQRRADLRRHYLGAWPPAEYPEVFTRAALAAMAGQDDSSQPLSAAS